MYKNLSKQRFILIICIALFLIVIVFAQFIVLSVLKTKELSLNSKLDKIQDEVSASPQNPNEENIEDALRNDGFVYDDEKIVVGE
ncbi:MAG: hypothetical protein IJ837_00445 [Clostridia bacterium]|nr:hypothetical protein [Clostridia bacterium]